MSEQPFEEIVVPEDEVDDEVSTLDPDATDDDDIIEADDPHPDNDDPEPVDE